MKENQELTKMQIPFFFLSMKDNYLKYISIMRSFQQQED